MALDLSSTSPLFTKLGRIGKMLLLADTYQAGIDAATDDLFDEYDATDRPITAAALLAGEALKPNAVAGLGEFVTLAQQTLVKLVGDDAPIAGSSVEAALAELIRQMDAGSKTVKRCTVSATATAFSGSIGTGRIVVTATRGDGLAQENLRIETARVLCTGDSYSDGQTAGIEPFAFFGAPANAGALDYNFPGASGASAFLTAVNADNFGTSGTLLANGGMEDFTAPDLPDSWTVTVGGAGTELEQDTVEFYRGESSLKLIGSTTKADLSQVPGATLVPFASYAFHAWVRTSGVPAAGVLTVDLYSDSEADVVADNEGTDNSFTTSLPALTGATWTPIAGVFRMPKNVPTDAAIRIRLTTALSTGTDLNIDDVCFARMTTAYAGGPGVAVFSGATPFVIGDGWNVATANNRGGGTHGATFQTFFDRCLGMAALGLVLPSDASPTIPDTLITS